jgi:TolB-like protein/cytochrome c-type biogenesis protein CcmH/NrfG
MMKNWYKRVIARDLGTIRMAKIGFLHELRRRHVWRVAVAYAIVGWLLIQVATQVFPVFHMPDWTEQLVVLLVLLGFPVAVILAWAFEVTPEGIRRTEPATSDDARAPEQTRRIGRGLNFAIIGVLVLAVAALGWRQWRPAHPEVPAAKVAMVAPASSAGATVATAATAFAPPTGTLVVLPFTNLGNDPSQAYFSDGITEELTNALGKNTALRVIAWDTASKYRSSTQAATAIGKALNVAALLHGSIRRQDGTVRVTAELVDTTTGYQMWSDHYDDTLKNIFAVQDRISQAIADALKTKFPGARGTQTVDPQAHDLLLKSMALLRSGRTAADYDQARKDLELAVALDPDYADAHAALARTWFDLTQFSTLSLQDALPKVRAEIDKALALDPDNVYGLLVQANVDITEGRNAKARAGYERVLQIDPSNASAHLDYALVLPPEQSLQQSLEAVRLDPEQATAQSNLALAYMDLGRYQDSLPVSLALIRLVPNSPDSAFGLAQNYTLLQRHADAVKAFDLVTPVTPLARQLVAAGRLVYQSVLDPKLRPRAVAAVNALRERKDLDPGAVANLTQMYSLLGERTPLLEMLPGLCAGSPAACSDLSLNPAFRLLRGDVEFERLVKQYDTTGAS